MAIMRSLAEPGGTKVVLIASLTAFWVDLMVRGWQHCGKLKVVDGTIPGVSDEEISGTADRRNLRGSKSYLSVEYHRQRNTRKAWRRSGLARFYQRPDGSMWDKSLLHSLEEMWRLDKVVRAIVSGDGSHGAASSVAQAAMMSPSVDRLLQEFLLGGESLSPPCAGQDEQTREEAQECFSKIMETPALQNVAARMYSGQGPFVEGDTTTETRKLDKGEYDRLLRDALAGVCRMNFIALSEAPGTSLLLLLEVSPWILPETKDIPHTWGQDARDGSSSSSSRPSCGGEESTSTERKLRRLRYITGDLRAAAVALNQVDGDLYSFVTAKLCSTLQNTGLLRHPNVEAELGRSLIAKRCASREWYEGIIDQYHENTRDCRLFQTLALTSPASTK